VSPGTTTGNYLCEGVRPAPPDRGSSEPGSWFFEVDDSYELFEFDIEAAILGLRDDADEWPPRYQSWAAS